MKKTAPTAEMCEQLRTILAQKRMGKPLSIEGRARAHLVIGALPDDESVMCVVCQDERRATPNPAVWDFRMCREHLANETDERVTMT
ncbi:MAG: hypothetical protein AAB601_00355 [Patescibacteria group bacterium]